MIRILERFVALSQKAQRVLRRLAPLRGSSQMDFMQMFMNMALQERLGSMQGLSPSEYEEISEEELDEDTKRVIEKIRGIDQKSRQNV